MSSYVLSSILSFFILPVAVVGIFRLRMILPADRPFIYLLCLGSVNEVLLIVFARTIRNNMPCANIYTLFDAFVLAQIFFNWGCLRRAPLLFRIIQVFLMTTWLWQIHSFAGLFTYNPLFTVVYSCILVLMGIDRINHFIITEREGLLGNGRFLIAMSLVVSSSYEALQELVFWIYPNFSPDFYVYESSTLEIVMVFVNIGMLLGVIRLPKRERFTLSAM